MKAFSLKECMMTGKFNFDSLIERKGTDSFKWATYGPDVLPLWVADMDFMSPPAILEALHKRVEHGVFGYAAPSEELRQVVVERMDKLYQWKIQPEDIVFLPGIVTGLNQYCHAFSDLSHEVIIQTPVYPPFLSAPCNAGLQVAYAPLIHTARGKYEIDFNSLESQMKAGVKLFILCSPHNPVGRVWTRAELEQMAALCNHYDVILCSDEIHSDLVFPGHSHIPIATLSQEIEQRTITFLAPSKTYNVAGLDCALAIIPNQELKKKFERGNKGLVPHVNIMGLVAAQAAFQGGAEWLAELLVYLQGNRDYLTEFITSALPELSIYPAEGTYLAWIDCTQAQFGEDPGRFFLKECSVALNDGASFGNPGKGFVRLNFGCPKSILQQALDQISNGVKNYKSKK
jgi:cysteine-S-conjugate beta-lyase